MTEYMETDHEKELLDKCFTDIRLFVSFMKAKIRANIDRGHWEGIPDEELVATLLCKASKLSHEIHYNDKEGSYANDAVFMCANIANYAMCIATNILRDRVDITSALNGAPEDVVEDMGVAE